MLLIQQRVDQDLITFMPPACRRCW